MRTVEKMTDNEISHKKTAEKVYNPQNATDNAWGKIAPTWPLKNLIAVNPLSGLEDLSFEEALLEGQAYFQQKDLPLAMKDINRHTIKWLQAFFEQGQATIKMPLRHQGLFSCVFSLLAFDRDLKATSIKTWQWIKELPHEPEKVMAECLLFLGISEKDREQFLTLMLSTLPGWAAYIKYRVDWADSIDQASPYAVSKHDYLALRLVLTCLIWPKAKSILEWHREARKKSNVDNAITVMSTSEEEYRTNLLKQFPRDVNNGKGRPTAQFIFCIDVRSEPFRRALEEQGEYDTYGFAGFFGIPVSVENHITGEAHASCPVLLKPAYHVSESPCCDHDKQKASSERSVTIKKLYQSLKYTFATPFTLVELLGPFAGILMLWRNLSYRSYAVSKGKISASGPFTPQLSSIPLQDQVSLAAGALKTMGLTENFAPLVVLCGHGSETQNNAYATALDCGACGGHHGAPNARILAAILNNREVAIGLSKAGIDIPKDTYFVAAEHNTTTDEVCIYAENVSPDVAINLVDIKKDLEAARKKNSLWRASQMGQTLLSSAATTHTLQRAADWAQVRPEWGLARNASFIVGPRALTKGINLEGRSFLHSYKWQTDTDGSALRTILTAPMVVAQWINAQYLFSTFDNVAYGGGSKISKNITGKIGIMQGNASDLMHGLPLQSVYKSDKEPYHEPIRLTTIVYAPMNKIMTIVLSHAVLKKLFGNGWVNLVCINPQDMGKYKLNRQLTWEKIV